VPNRLIVLEQDHGVAHQVEVILENQCAKQNSNEFNFRISNYFMVRDRHAVLVEGLDEIF